MIKPFARADRVSVLIRQTLSELLRRDIKDPRLEMVTITAVKLSRDLKNARIYFAVSGGEENIRGAQKGFERALGYIRRTLASELELRYMPTLKFFYDESFDYGTRIDQLLKSIKDTDETDYTPTEKS